jgi:conserved oligomeric Golgi complex subunit 2
MKVSASTPRTSTLLPPKTPFTPYTALHHQASFSAPSGASDSPYVHILEQSEDPIAKLYLQIIRFIERDLISIMQLAERINVKSVSTVAQAQGLTIAGRSTPIPSVGKSSAAAPRTEGQRFDIMSNVVWEEFARSIIDDIGTVVFAAGKPDDFKKVPPLPVRLHLTGR